jgi:hypothetical protein
MALQVETGSGLVDAESYASVAQFRDYWTKRGTDVSGLTDMVIEGLLRQGFDYMLENFRMKWNGFRVTTEQFADWPRDYCPRDPTLLAQFSTYQYTNDNYYPNNVVPVEVVRANIELANLAQTERLSIESERLTTQEKVGSLSVSYDKSARDKRTFPFIDNLLRPFLKNGGGGTVRRA